MFRDENEMMKSGTLIFYAQAPHRSGEGGPQVRALRMSSLPFLFFPALFFLQIRAKFSSIVIAVGHLISPTRVNLHFPFGTIDLSGGLCLKNLRKSVCDICGHH